MKTNEMDDILRARLRHITESCRERLQPAVRQGLIREGVAQAAIAGRAGWRVKLEPMPRYAAAAAVLAFMVLLGLQVSGSSKAKESTVRDLQAGEVDGRVVLTWQNGDEPHTVVRATSREMLRQAGSLSGEMVTGKIWVDTKDDAAPIVFYLVN